MHGSLNIKTEVQIYILSSMPYNYRLENKTFLPNQMRLFKIKVDVLDSEAPLDSTAATRRVNTAER